jgi:hypothetical protein
MPRVREITLDNIKVKISPFSYDEFEKYVIESKELLARDPKPTLEEWGVRTLNTVVLALNKGAAASGATNGNAMQWDVKRLTAEFDMVTINDIYEEFMKMSGLRAPVSGEAPATSILP